MLPTPQGITIRKDWRTWKVIPLAVFVVVWDSFLVGWYGIVLSKPDAPLMTALFPLGHLAVGVGLTYFVLASLVNKTDVEISSMGVRVVTRPAPWIGNKAVALSDLMDILVRERAGGRGSVGYAVMYVDRFNKERPLLRAFAYERDQAEFVANTIREKLGIQTRRAASSTEAEPHAALDARKGAARS